MLIPSVSAGFFYGLFSLRFSHCRIDFLGSSLVGACARVLFQPVPLRHDATDRQRSRVPATGLVHAGAGGCAGGPDLCLAVQNGCRLALRRRLADPGRPGIRVRAAARRESRRFSGSVQHLADYSVHPAAVDGLPARSTDHPTLPVHPRQRGAGFFLSAPFHTCRACFSPSPCWHCTVRWPSP